MSTTLHEDVAANIRELLHYAHRSQRGLAAYLKEQGHDIAESGLSRRLNGHQVFDLAELETVAAYLEVEARVILKPADELALWVIESGWLLRVRSRCVAEGVQPTLPGFDGGVWAGSGSLRVDVLVAA